MSKNIFNEENYEKKINYEDVNKIVLSFNKILNNFTNHILEKNTNNEEDHFKYIHNIGIETLTHVFNFLLLYTKNIELIIIHCEKAYLYFTEFIGQIGHESKGFLQLTSKDAILFVYKKTIFDINNEFKKTFETNDEDKIVMNTINLSNKIIHCYKNYVFDKFNLLQNKDNIESIYENINFFITSLMIVHNNNIFKRLDKFKIMFEIIQNLNLKNIELTHYNSICLTICKKIKKDNIDIRRIVLKINGDNFYKNLTSFTTNKFVNWLLF
jgi:hypothetical protein